MRWRLNRETRWRARKFRRCAGWQKGERVKEQKLKPLHTTKAFAVVGEARDVVAAKGATRDAGVVGPIAAAQNTVAQWPGRSRWVIRRGLSIRRRIPIPTPLIDIPRHVV